MVLRIPVPSPNDKGARENAANYHQVKSESFSIFRSQRWYSPLKESLEIKSPGSSNLINKWHNLEAH